MQWQLVLRLYWLLALVVMIDVEGSGTQLQPIQTLSDESESAPKIRVGKRGMRQQHRPAGACARLQLPAVDHLTDSSSHSADFREMGLGKRKRKARQKPPGPSPRERLVSDVHIRATLGKMCKGCHRVCLAKFLRRELFATVVEFRQEWQDLHKLDQDRIVTMLWANSFVFVVRLVCLLNMYEKCIGMSSF